ncbi:MAG: LPS-assembly protein LptD [Desulfovibrionales bacterium]|nr:LPS-assembly protein LptD [Desulfovibrionales bacterium]
MKKSLLHSFIALVGLLGLLLQNANAETWRLYADKTAASHDNNFVEAFGNVVLDRQGDYIKADYARYYHSTKWVYLKGNIDAKFQGDYLKADEAEFDLDSNTGWLKDGQIFMDDPHMYFTGALLKKTGPETYEFREATVTICDGDRPAWSIKTTRGDVTVDGYAHLWGPRFQVLDQPLLFSPYAVIPVKTKRQSGFLIPEIGSSDRLGLFVNQPYYHVLGEEHDITLFANAMTTRGLMLGAEYRHTPNIHSKGLWHVDYLQDLQTESTSRYEDNQDMTRSNKSRWWIRGKYDGYLGEPDWILKMDLDLVSDQDYLRDFSSGYSGFKKSRRDFLQSFGRDIEDNDNNLRVNRMLISHNWAQVGVQGLLEYTQNLTYGNNNKNPGMDHSADPTIQRLPEINLHVYPVSLAATPFTFEGSGQFVSFWREYGTTGTRFDVHPIISFPFHVEFGSLIPKAGWRGTTYFLQRFENDEQVDNEHDVRSRSVPDFSATAYTELSRIFSLATNADLSADQDTWLDIRHAIQPRLEYTYIPDIKQDDLPYFDPLDRIEATNELRYSLTNILTTKTGRLQPDPNKQGALGAVYDYFELGRLRLEQGYNIEEASRTEDLHAYARRPFTDILADLTTELTPWVSVRNKSWYSPYLNKITEHEHSLFLHSDLAYGSFSLDFLEALNEFTRQNQERERIAGFGGGLRINNHWSADFLYRVDYESSTDLEKRLSVRYDHQCFSTEVYWSISDTDTRFGLFFNLAQLGSFGR